MTIQKGEKVIVRSKHQHWLLADLSGRRGWVPSCYVSIEGIENGLFFFFFFFFFQFSKFYLIFKMNKKDDEWHE